jgi:hypothetical protein
MLRMLGRYRDELGVEALTDELEAAARAAADHVGQDTASVAIAREAIVEGRLRFEVSIVNRAGHKFPTAYPSRRAWLEVTVRDRQDRIVFSSGALRPDGSIAGNANDEDGARYEPHYEEITAPEQVQIYEAVMAGPDGAVTTGLLTAVRFIKDNRLLPRGFDKATAGDDIAVHGRAAGDEDFTGGSDRVRYVVPLAGATGPYHVEATLWFQPVAYRWARNLASYQAPEIDRFVGYYESMADGSATVVARVTAIVVASEVVAGANLDP